MSPVVCIYWLLVALVSLPNINAFGLSTLNALTTRILSSSGSAVGGADSLARRNFEEFETLKSEGLLTKSDIGAFASVDYQTRATWMNTRQLCLTSTLTALVASD